MCVSFHYIIEQKLKLTWNTKLFLRATRYAAESSSVTFWLIAGDGIVTGTSSMQFLAMAIVSAGQMNLEVVSFCNSDLFNFEILAKVITKFF